MARFHDEGNELCRIVVDRHDVHLCTRNHHVAHGHLGDLQRTLDDGKRVGVEQAMLERAVEERKQLLAVLRLADKERGETLEQRRARRLPAGSVLAHRDPRREPRRRMLAFTV